MRICLGVAAAMLFCAPALAEVYKWVDEHGVVHFSDKMPQSTQPETIEIPPETERAPANIGAGVYDEAIEEARAWRKQHEAERQQSRDEREAREQSEHTSADSCARAIHRLNILKTPCPVFYDGAGYLRDQCPGLYLAYAGERTYVDDSERAELIEHYSRIVAMCRQANRER
jgi:hypothetical protein